jgi:hypothetical protein
MDTTMDAPAGLEALWTAATAALQQRDTKERDVLRSLCDDLRRSGVFGQAFAAGLRRMHDDPGHIPSGCAAGTWKLHEDDCITATWLREPRARPEVLLVGVAGAIYLTPRVPTALRIRTYRTDRPIRVDAYDPAVRLLAVDERALDEPFVAAAPADGHGQAWQILGGAPELVLRIALRERQPFLWDFDPATLAPRLLVPSGILAARQRLMLDFLQASAHGELEAFAGHLLQSGEYFLRWAAMQAIVERQPARMREMLERGCRDGHPEIRATAQRLLQQLTEPQA